MVRSKRPDEDSMQDATRTERRLTPESALPTNSPLAPSLTIPRDNFTQTLRGAKSGAAGAARKGTPSPKRTEAPPKQSFPQIPAAWDYSTPCTNVPPRGESLLLTRPAQNLSPHSSLGEAGFSRQGVFSEKSDTPSDTAAKLSSPWQQTTLVGQSCVTTASLPQLPVRPAGRATEAWRT